VGGKERTLKRRTWDRDSSWEDMEGAVGATLDSFYCGGPWTDGGRGESMGRKNMRVSERAEQQWGGAADNIRDTKVLGGTKV